MKIPLFHEDNLVVLDTDTLRNAARDEVRSCALVVRAARGDHRAAQALHVGFWEFVREFETAIDRHRFDRAPLATAFSANELRRVFQGLFLAVRRMRHEEGSHAACWAADAHRLGLWDEHLYAGPVVPGVKELVARAHTAEHTRFFSVLAGTEFIAEELGTFLTQAPPFTSLFSNKRWRWGEIHIAPHEGGPSHLEIDIDLARAYGGKDSVPRIREMVLDTIRLFGKAAEEVDTICA